MKPTATATVPGPGSIIEQVGRERAHKRLSLRLPAFAVLALAANMVFPATAQNVIGSDGPHTQGAGAPSDAEVPEIIVTAQFRSENLQQTPIAITAVNSAMLEARSATNIVDVANQAPSVTLKPAGAASGPSLQASIRGVGQTDFNLALEPGVGFYVDDVYYSTITGAVLDLLDLDRVEVLRGPQGTLSGKNSIGGSIKLYSKKPTGDNEGYLSGTVGDYGRLQFHGAADFTVVPDKVFVRISGLTNSVNGYVTRYDYRCLHPEATDVPTVQTHGSDCKLGMEGGREYSAVRGALRLLPADRIEINLIGDYTRDTSEVQAMMQTYAGAPTPPSPFAIPGYDARFLSPNAHTSFATFCDNKDYPLSTGTATGYCVDPINGMKSWGVSGQVTWDLGSQFKLDSITAYRRYNAQFTSDGDGSPFGVYTDYNQLLHRQFSQELRLNGSFGKLIDFTVGGFYLDARSVNKGRIDAPVLFGTDFLLADRVKSDTEAAFAHAVAHILPKLNLTGGIRYTKESKDYTYLRQNVDGTPSPVNGVTAGYNGSHWDYRLSLDYQLMRNVLVYAEYSTGFKGGGPNPRPFSPDQAAPSSPFSRFAPETLKSYEVGVKSTLLDHRLRLNLAAFTSDYSNIQLQITNCGGEFCAAEANVGDARIKGVEAEATARLFGSLSVDASASYLDFKYKDVNPLTAVQLSYVTPLTPKWKWSAGIQYDLDLGSGGTVTPRLDASYQSQIYSDPVNLSTNRVAPYTLLNARLTYRPSNKHWEGAVEITNLTNKTYFYNVFDQNGLLGLGYSDAQVAPPRRWAATLKYNF